MCLKSLEILSFQTFLINILFGREMAPATDAVSHEIIQLSVCEQHFAVVAGSS